MEALGWRWLICRLARIAVPACRAPAALAQRLRMVRAGPLALVVAFGRHGSWARAPAPSTARRVLSRLRLRRALVCRQLLLDLRHHAYPRRAAAGGVGADPAFVFFGAGPLLRPLRPGRRAGSARNRLGPVGARVCTVLLGCARTGGRAHHQRSVGPARLLASGQRSREPACALDGSVWDQFLAGRSERSSRGWRAAPRQIEEPFCRTLGMGCMRRRAAHLRFLRHLFRVSEAESLRYRRPHPAQPRRRKHRLLACSQRLGKPHRRLHRARQRELQNIYRRNTADRRAERRNHLPALSHASRSHRLAGITRAVFRGRAAL